MYYEYVCIMFQKNPSSTMSMFQKKSFVYYEYVYFMFQKNPLCTMSAITPHVQRLRRNCASLAYVADASLSGK